MQYFLTFYFSGLILTVAGQTFTVTQEAYCIYNMSPSSQSFTASGGSGTINVTSECAWKATSNYLWITIISGNSGNGNGTVTYSVAQNTGSSRTGELRIGGQNFTITQSAGNTGLFPDKNLEAAIRQAINKPTGDILTSDLQSLTFLDASGKGIVNIEGLQYCTNLTTLRLHTNQISNISSLAGLTKLTELWLDSNQISDISALAGLTNLTLLYLSSNQVSNISALAGLTKLFSLGLMYNQVSDISALSGLTNLNNLYFYSNQIGNISVLAGLTNLTALDLCNNRISSIGALAGLTKLNSLWLRSNQISNISALAGLTKLVQLDLSNNQISNISVLAGLTYSCFFSLDDNQISDISPLVSNSGCVSPGYLTLGGNPLSSTSCTVYIPQLKSRGVTVTLFNNCP